MTLVHTRSKSYPVRSNAPNIMGCGSVNNGTTSALTVLLLETVTIDILQPILR